MKLLIADAERVSQLAIKRTLEKENYSVEVYENGDEAFEIIQAQRDVRIAIIDITLPGIDGLSLCRKVRKQNLPRYVYLILILSNQKKDMYNAMEAGADDYIYKPFDKDNFISRIKVAERLLSVEDKLFKSQKELIKLVKEDPLTTLLNRRSFLDESIKLVDRAAREGHLLSTIMVDIDNFNQINEALGHKAGDRVLIEVANRLQYACRPYDLIGRYGGEEFLILLSNTKTSSAVRIAKRIRSVISGKSYQAIGHEIDITASYGVSLISPDIGLKDNQINELINRTEIALQKAKKEGKDKIAVNTES